MSISEPFIRRPIGTLLLALGIALAGIVAYFHLPIAPLPRIDIPTIVVTANQPGADPAIMSNSVTAPLERRLGAIAGLTEMTSTTSLGAASIVLQFDLSKTLKEAAQDAQAAINAAMQDLPAGLPNPPSFRRANPADAPIMILSLRADTVTPGAIYDAADSIVAPRIAQVAGVSQVIVAGGEQPAIRIAIDPGLARAAGVGMEAIRQAITQANVNQPTGMIEGPLQAGAITVNDKLRSPEEFGRIVVRQKDGAITRIDAIGRVTLDQRDRRQGGSVNGRPAAYMVVIKQADATVIEVVDNVLAALPGLARWLPGGVEVEVLRDRSTTIRASVAEVQMTLLLSVGLVIAVTAVFLRRTSAVVATGAAVPLSLLGTFAAMWLLGYSLDNLSLMALTISVGFVVDDAIVMIENMTRLRERGLPPLRAAIEGARQIGFTVVSMTVSLIAVFIPLLFMGGLIGRLFREFSVVLAVAVALSGLVSLTVTPMLAARLGRAEEAPPGRLARALDAGMAWLTDRYMASLAVVLRFRRLALLATLGLIGLTVWLYTVVPKEFFPDQDTGLIIGSTRAPPDISYAAMLEAQAKIVAIIQADPGVDNVASTVGGGFGNAVVSTGRLFISLKPLEERDGVSAERIVARLRRPLAAIPGIQTFLRAIPEIGMGGRPGNAQFQFVLLSPDLERLAEWSEVLVRKLRTLPGIADVNSDQQRAGLVTRLVIDREAAARLGVAVQAIAGALNSSFAQRQVAIIYRPRNQYRVVLEIDPEKQQAPEQVDDIWLPGAGGVMVPLSAVTRLERGTAPLFVTHQGLYPAATITFNLNEGTTLGQATAMVEQATAEVGLPDGLRTEFAGNARAFQSFARDQPLLILAALITIYIVLGILYEHLLHPITILSTLPTAGIGALLALLATGTAFSVIALIGVILLMGIVKKNAIMIVDFALEHAREEGIGGREAVLAACRERFRPILMTTLAAVLGALPLVLGSGPGSELRYPLGVTLIGGLLLAQLVTLYTTPVVYLALDFGTRRRARGLAPAAAE